MNRMLFRNRLEFRAWLMENALADEGVWLVFDKKANPETLKASEALEEALCFGWIDGQIQCVDPHTYLKYFKQRGKTSDWSEKNKTLAERLESQGLMTDFGRAKMDYAKQNGFWNSHKPEPLTDEQLQQFEDMLLPYGTAHANYRNMPRSARKAYAASCLLGAKTEAGRQRRFDTIVERLNLNLNPMESMEKARKKTNKEEER